MILTENKLKELTLAADVLSKAHRQTRFFQLVNKHPYFFPINTMKLANSNELPTF